MPLFGGVPFINMYISTRTYIVIGLCLLLCNCGTIPERGTIRDNTKEGTIQYSEPAHDIEGELFFLLNGL